jgi:hypothetical protein
MTVTWRDHTFDPRTRDQLVELERIYGKRLDVMQGSYNRTVQQSAKTHWLGGAADIDDDGMDAPERNAFVRDARTVGFAAWWRPAIPDKWGSHFHLISIQPGGKSDQGVLHTDAWGQVKDYYAGLNGLSNDGPDPHKSLNAPKQTWETYKSKRDEDDMPLTDADVQKIAAAVWAIKFREYVDENGNKVRDSRTTGDVLFATHANTVEAERK